MARFRPKFAGCALVILAALALAQGQPGPATRPDEAALARDLLHQAQQLVVSGASRQFTIDVAELLAANGDADAADAVMKVLGPTRQPDRFTDVLWRRMATAYARGGDVARARQTIDRIRDAEKGYASQRPLAWLHVGRALAERGDKAAAAEAFQEAVRSMPTDNPYPYSDGMFLGEVAEGQYRLGLTDEAMKTFGNAIQRALSDAKRTLRSVGVADIAVRQVKLGLLNSALVVANQLGAPDEQQLLWLKIVETLAGQNLLDDAANVAEKMTFSWSINAASFALADAYGKAGRIATAKERLKRVEVAWSDLSDPESRILTAKRLGQAYGAIGDRDQAAMWLKRAAAHAGDLTIPERKPLDVIEVVPGAVRRQYHLREIAVAQGKLEFTGAARDTFERAKAAARGERAGMWQTTAFWVIAKSQAEAGMPDDALLTLQSLPEADRNWLVYVDIAAAKTRAGHLDEALKIAPSSGGPVAMRRITEVLTKLDKLQDALRVGLEADGEAEVLRPIARQYSARGDLTPLMQAINTTGSADKRVALLLGAVEGLLDCRTQAGQTRPATGQSNRVTRLGGLRVFVTSW